MYYIIMIDTAPQAGGLHEFMGEAEDCHDGTTGISSMCAWLKGVLPFEITDYASWDDLLLNREDSGFVVEAMPYWASPHFFNLPQEAYQDLSEPDVADWPLEAYIAMMVADDTDSEDIIIKFFKLLVDIGNEMYFDTSVDGPAPPPVPEVQGAEAEAGAEEESEAEAEAEAEWEADSEADSEWDSESESEYKKRRY